MTEEIQLAHLPPELKLYVTCYIDVENAAYLRQQLLSANQEFNYAFLDVSSILSRRHVLAACFRALNDQMHDRLKSNNVQSEIVFCLNPNNNIGEAFRRFGIQDNSRDLVVVKAGEGLDRSIIEHHLAGAVQGTRVDFTDEWLRNGCDLDKVRKTYKIAKAQQGGKVINGAGHDTDERKYIETQVLGFMALRGAA